MEDMGIEVDVKRKFVVDGREYGSLEDVPRDAREAIRNAIASGKNIEVVTDSSIVFNGRQYGSVSEMPPSERAVYEDIMEKVASGAAGCKGKEGVDPSTAGIRVSGEINPSSAAGPGASLSFSLSPAFAAIAAAIAAILYFR